MKRSTPFKASAWLFSGLCWGTLFTFAGHYYTAFAFWALMAAIGGCMIVTPIRAHFRVKALNRKYWLLHGEIKKARKAHSAVQHLIDRRVKVMAEILRYAK